MPDDLHARGAERKQRQQSIPPNHRKSWTPTDNAKLKQLIKGNTPTPLMAYDLGRTPAAGQGHANDLGLSTKPTNKSPYNRRRK